MPIYDEACYILKKDPDLAKAGVKSCAITFDAKGVPPQDALVLRRGRKVVQIPLLSAGTSRQSRLEEFANVNAVAQAVATTGVRNLIRDKRKTIVLGIGTLEQAVSAIKPTGGK